MKARYARRLTVALFFALIVSFAANNAAYAENIENTENTTAETTTGVSAVLLASETTAPVATGMGTPENPEIITSSSTTTVIDPATGNIITTTDTEKTWSGSDGAGGSGGSVTGKESDIDTEQRDKDGNLIGAQGTAVGEETTIDKTETDNGENGESVIIDNGTGTTSDGKTVNSDVPDLTVELKPGDEDIKDREKADTWFDESTLGLPDWVYQKGEDGSATWAGESSAEDNGTVTTVTVSSGTADESGKTATSYVRTVTAPDGSTSTQTVHCVRDAEGRIVSYNVETVNVKTDASGGATPSEGASSGGGEGGDSGAGKTSSVTTVELPEKPAVTVTEYYADGTVKNGEVVTELLDGSGNVVGYTVTTLKDGVAVSYSQPVLGRYVVTTTVEEDLGNGLKKVTTTKTYTTHVDITSESGSLQPGWRELIGWMGSVTENEDTADGTLEGTFVPGKINEEIEKNKTDFENDLFNRIKKNIAGYDANSPYPIQYLGEISLESAIRVRAYEKYKDKDVYYEITTGQAHIFILQDGPDEDGKTANRYYVYCCDYDTSANHGMKYNIQRLEDADYYSHDDNNKAKNQIRAIVLNGYWGVTNEGGSENPTAGSLEAFKKMLVDSGNITAEEAESLTDGMALTATQAAIWYYGSSDREKSLNLDDIVGVYCNGYTDDDPINGNLQSSTVSGDKKDIINRIYRYLINVDNNGLPGREPTSDNNLLHVNDFAQSLTLTVGARDENNNYDTTITFSMTEISENTKNDLVVYVKDGDNLLCGYRLCGNSEEDAQKNIKSAIKNKDGTYTLANVLLPAGENVNLALNLSGTQVIENGALLFSCTDGYTAGQTFIGGGKYTKGIDFSVNFGFEIHDPAVAYSSSALTSGAEKLEWTSEYHTVELPRNTDIPKTGDSLCALELALALGALVSLASAAAFIARAKKAEV